ncbi:MAG: serine/threonine protein kinase [Thaumarchaeota archaeon]|nr:serine/threonine protein kinase [Nitrososphaerota archaeon]
MGQIGNYKIGKMIAEGGFARIFQVEHVLLEELACMKQPVKNSDDYNDLLRQEAKILWKLNEHHSVPHTKDFIRLDNGYCIMVMDYIDGKTLDGMIPDGHKMHPEDVCWITERLLDALRYCHYSGVVHGDVKPGNIIVEEKKHDIKLIDFGLSLYKPKSGARPLGFTEAYVAPEILEGKTPVPETDLFGVGLVMLYALGGNIFTKQLPDNVPEPIKRFCSSLLRYDPMQRPNWEKGDLVKALSDVRQDVFGRRRTEVYNKTRL